MPLHCRSTDLLWSLSDTLSSCSSTLWVNGKRPAVQQMRAAQVGLTCIYALCRGSPYALRGCINDVHCMRHLLITRFGFTDADIQLLTDDQAHPAGWPTRGNMLYQVRQAFVQHVSDVSLFPAPKIPLGSLPRLGQLSTLCSSLSRC